MSGPRGITKRNVLILLVVVLVLFGLGAGIVDMGDTEPSAGNSVSTPETRSTPDPGQPTVTVTPPEPTTPGTATTTKTPETTTETSDPAVDTSLHVEVASPDDVANDHGRVGPLWGSVSGTLAWDGSIDSVVVVVSVLAPEEGWVERERVTVRPDGDSLSLESLLDSERYRYLGAERAAGFRNPNSGTTASRTGVVGVTAVLFEDGQERARVADTATYRFEVTNTGGVDISVSESDDEPEEVDIDPSSGDDVVPGANAGRSMTVNNTGQFAGTVRVFLTDVRGSENGFASPEAPVDDDQESELLEQLQLRMAVLGNDGRQYVLGGPSAWVDLDQSVQEGSQITSFDLDPGANRTLVVEWRLPSSAGNEVMTDTAHWDVEFVFETAGAG